MRTPVDLACMVEGMDPSYCFGRKYVESYLHVEWILPYHPTATT
jgi:hypothetical protein